MADPGEVDPNRLAAQLAAISAAGLPETVGAATRALARRLADAGVDEPAVDARLLVATATGLDMAAILAFPERRMAPDAHARLAAFAARRTAREPVSRIVGQRGFYGLDLAVAPATLDPRPDTETVVTAVLDHVRHQGLERAPLRILDLGTGSGAILLALLANLPEATGLGTDISADALAVAAANAKRHGLADRAEFIASDWLASIPQTACPFDVVVSNPPYIPAAIVATLEPEVRLYDPPAALIGGDDGLDAYRRIVSQAGAVMRSGALIALEIGHDQADAVSALLVDAGFEVGCGASRQGRGPADAVRYDLAGHPRCVCATRRNACCASDA